MVKRTETHIIDTLALRKVIATLSPNWIIRDLTERDYGIDMMVEYFDGQNPTGRVAFFQIKGTTTPVKAKHGVIPFSLKKKTLGYTECFSVPFILLYCQVNDKTSPVYFLWLQKYIMTTLHAQSPQWRTTQQEEYTLYIPSANALPKNEIRLLSFCQSPQMMGELHLFLSFFNEWPIHYNALRSGDVNAIKPCSQILAQISTLTIALLSEHAHFDAHDLMKGIEALERIRIRGIRNARKSWEFISDLTERMEMLKTGTLWPRYDQFKLDMTGEVPY